MRDSSKKLLNPVVTYRIDGEQGLRKKLELIELAELKKITRTYTPDCNGVIYRLKDTNKIIDYIIERAEKLSCLGQCFRQLDEEDKE